jgi:hypothetical protein
LKEEKYLLGLEVEYVLLNRYCYNEGLVQVALQVKLLLILH